MKKLHFTGIGGAGMAPLAELSAAKGFPVSGSDEHDSPKCRHLASLGINVVIGHNAENLPPDAGMLIYSSAVPESNCERMRATQLNIPQLRRGNYLALFSSSYRRCVSVTGTHGKSSITSSLVSILRKCGKNPGFMIGAEIAGLPVSSVGDGDIFVTEADESDGTHTLMKNFLAVIPNVEDDHEWSLGGKDVLEANFRTVAANSEYLLYYASAECDRLFNDHPRAIRLPEIPGEFAGLSGFQAANAYIAAQAAVLLGCEENTAMNAAADYPQVARRMNVVKENSQYTLIEDYAHHPTEVRAALDFLRKRYPGKHLRVLFQPHRYARLEKYFDQFAAVLKEADSLFIAPVFAAWSESGPVNSESLANAANGTAVNGNYADWAEICLQKLPPDSVIAVLGAGDIDQTLPFFP